MNMFGSIVLVTILALIYSAIIYRRQQEKFWDWLNTLASTGLSFFLALVAGIYLFNQQTMETGKSTKEDLHKLLSAELSDCLRILNSTSRTSITFPDGKKTTALVTFVQPLVIEKAALSGLYPPVESENLLHISRRMRLFNLKVDHFQGLIRARADEQSFRIATTNIEETRLATVDGIRFIATQLNVKLNEKYPKGKPNHRPDPPGAESRKAQ